MSTNTLDNNEIKTVQELSSLNDEDNGVVADPSVISEVTIVDEPNEVTKDIPVLEDKETEIDEPTIIDEEIETPILDDINIYGGNNPKTNIKVKKFKEESYKKDIPAEEIEVL